MHLIPEAKQWYKMASNWLFAAIAILSGVEAKWDVFSTVLPEAWYPYVVAILAFLGIIARLINQGIKP